MDGNVDKPEPCHANSYLGVDGTVTCGIPEGCQIKRRASFSHKRIGVCVLVFDPKRGILVGKRRGSHGAGKWATPGGHTELEESLRQCVIREVLEETGLEVTEPQFLEFTDDNFIHPGGDKPSLKNYVTCWWVVRLNPSDKPENLEENKCEGWEWKTFPDLLKIYTTTPHELFLPLRHLFDDMPNWYDEILSKYEHLDRKQ